jgi:hypothetical protein
MGKCANTYARLDVETQAPHEDVPVWRHNRHVLKPNLIGFYNGTSSPENWRKYEWGTVNIMSEKPYSLRSPQYWHY